jgi:hypothetical protein
MEDPESAFCSAATGLGTAVITDEGVVVAGPVVIGTPVEGVVAGPVVNGTPVEGVVAGPAVAGTAVEGVVAGPAVSGTPVEGAVAGPAVAGTPVGCFAREVLQLSQGLNSIKSIFNRQEKKESAKVNHNRRLCWTCAGPRAGCE